MDKADLYNYATLIKKDYDDLPFRDFQDSVLINEGTDDVRLLYNPKELIILCRGTENFTEELQRKNRMVAYAMAFREWFWNIKTSPTEWMGTYVHEGFVHNVEALTAGLLTFPPWQKFAEDLRTDPRNSRLVIIGHSRGGAIPHLSG